VVGDRLPYLVALITVEPGLADPQTVAQAAVDEVNRERTRFEQIKKFVVLDRDFSPELGEVTPTMKLRRRAIVEHFADEIDQLYAG
jgi:long-chain acyl-CoA synthetase